MQGSSLNLPDLYLVSIRGNMAAQGGDAGNAAIGGADNEGTKIRACSRQTKGKDTDEEETY